MRIKIGQVAHSDCRRPGGLLVDKVVATVQFQVDDQVASMVRRPGPELKTAIRAAMEEWYAN